MLAILIESPSHFNTEAYTIPGTRGTSRTDNPSLRPHLNMIDRPEPGNKTLHEKRLLLLRHAETSAPDRFHGAESDIGLGERGIRQAEAVARVLAEERPEALYCSAMRRAIETARPIGIACVLTTVILPSLHERKMGPLSGMSREEGLAEYGQAKTYWMRGEIDYSHEGGESYREVRSRVVPVIQRLVEETAVETLVVVAHGVVIRIFLTTVLEGRGAADFDRFAIDNVAINDLRWDGDRWSAVSLNRRLVAELDSFAW